MTDALERTASPCMWRWAGYCLRYLVAEHALDEVMNRLRELDEADYNGDGLTVIGQVLGAVAAEADKEEAVCRQFKGLPCRLAADVPEPAAPSSAKGESVVSTRRSRGSGVMSVEQWAELARRLKLSLTELFLVQAVFDDRKERTIARRLDISPSAVHSRLKRLKLKLGVSNHAGIVRAILAECLIDPP